MIQNPVMKLSHPLLDALAPKIQGIARFDRLARTLFATDASIYEIIPAGVVWPKCTDDVVSIVHACREHAVPIVPRGAGTGLTGGCVGHGLVIDSSRFLTDIRQIDVANRTVRVQPGVVLDELNRRLAVHGLHFAPDVATANRATIGGMIANNSCGARSVHYGRTVDHVAELTVVLSDGNVVTWPAPMAEQSHAVSHIESELFRIAIDHREEVGRRFPKLMRHNGGYALDRICDDTGPINPVTIICGSEGTLCMVVEAVLKLTPLPNHTAMLIVHFDDLLDALSSTSAILAHRPSAIELVDNMILTAASQSTANEASHASVDLAATAVLLIELIDEDGAELNDRLRALMTDLEQQDIGRDRRLLTDALHQRAVWGLRRRGLGLLMSRPGDEQSYAFVEDTAVDPSRLREYIARFRDILAAEGIRQAGYYAHASVGVIHVRPVLNLKTAAGVANMRRIADCVSSLAMEFGGAMTGEHGDGLLRSCWLEKMYGPQLLKAFRDVKHAFDPVNLFNPGKIVDPLPMTENLRYGPQYTSSSVKTHLDFSTHGGPAGLAEMCSGVGECRKRLTGTMCPSYMATGDEMHTTRARANALRVAMSNRGMLQGLTDDAIDEAMDLCLSCKACKSECPTGVDMARLKSEWLSMRNMRDGVPARARFVADAPRWARRGQKFSRLANRLSQSSWLKRWLERRFGFDRRVNLVPLAGESFRDWYRKHRMTNPAKPDNRPRVVYFVDTWTNYFEPHIGLAAVRVLESAGFRVIVPSTECCGRTLISNGLLMEARHLAEVNVERLAPLAHEGVPIVGTEPSCIFTLVDEYPQLVRSADARSVADRAQPIESFLAMLARNDRSFLRHRSIDAKRVLYHGHCHQKALLGNAMVGEWMRGIPELEFLEIDSGCCGMAGSFGMERDHYDVGRAIGEERLFPAIRDAHGATIAASGFSCRHQIEHHTGVRALHPIEILAQSLV